MNRLDGKVCVVTGAASGIGKRIAEVYAQAGGKVVIAKLKLDAAEATANEIRDAGGEHSVEEELFSSRYLLERPLLKAIRSPERSVLLIDEIDKAIKRMEEVKKFLTTSENQLRLANNKLDDVSVKKLTRKNPTMKAKFEALKGE